MTRKRKKIFIGVAWPYVNGILHIGHLAGYLLPADIFARFQRLRGNDVLMVSGSDCHGTPITLEAEEKKTKPSEIVKIYHKKHKELFKLFNISFDVYTKTTTRNHKKLVQDVFLKLLRKNFIFKKKSLQYFSKKENRFLPDRYVEGTCPYCGFEHARGDQCDKCGNVLKEGELIKPRSKITGFPVMLKETEHYYFNLPLFSKFLSNYIKDKKKIWRKWIYQESLSWIKRELEPRSITRDIGWGITIPSKKIPQKKKIKNISKKRIYVWFEAVLGYISASREWDEKNWKKFWFGKNLYHYYFMGKDNLFFHSILFPSQLYGSFRRKIHLPDYLAVNHFLMLNGKPFSKSRRTIIDSKYIGEKYGVDPVRFYLTLIAPEISDSSFTWKGFVETNNNILIGNIGNFINRTLNLSKIGKNFSKKDIEKDIEFQVKKIIKESKENLEECKFIEFIRNIISLSSLGNKYLEEKSPWKLNKKSSEFTKIISNALFILLAIQLLLKPLLPQTTKKLSQLTSIDINFWPENETVFLKEKINKIKVEYVEALFRKIDPRVITEEN